MSVRLESRALCARRGRLRVLEDVCLRLGSGETWGLVGPNGAGKSSLLEALIGYLPLESGQVLLDGRPMESFSRTARARRVALVGRELTRDLAFDVRTLVELGRLPHRAGWAFSEEDRRAVEAALAETACLELASRPLYALSDGERQRVQWARALAQEPVVLLLDEATTHLDLAHRERTLLRARNFAGRGGTTLAVLHDLDLAVRHCTHVAVLRQGRLLAAGAPARVLTPALLRSVFDVEAEVEQHPSGLAFRLHGVLPCARP